ncbi:MAG: cysteine desulfurase [Phycisphaerae bacterium]
MIIDMREIIYLDNGATSWPKPPGVQREMARFLAEDAGNPGRSGHRMALAAEKMLDDVRGKLARLFDAADPRRIIFTLNCTDALNMAIKGVLGEGDHVITSMLEHNSVSRPLQALADAGRIALTRLPMAEGGFIDPAAVRRAVTPKTRLIAVTHCSNVLGTIQPAEEIGRIAREHDLLFLLDAAQSAGLIPISVRRMNIDLLAFPGHKALLGPAGTGGLYVGERADPAPWREGGSGGDSKSPVQALLEFPYRLEGGTPNTVGLAGLGAALDFLLERDPHESLEHERRLARLLVEALADDDRIALLGTPDYSRRAGVVALTAGGMPTQELASVLDVNFNIAVRPGLHCAPYIHKELGTFPDGALRVTPGPFSTEEDVRRLAEALPQIVL